MAGKRTLGFSPTALRKKFRAGMTVRNYRDNEGRLFARGYSGCCLLHPERHGEAHGGLHASQKSYNRLPAARYFFLAKAV